MDPLHPSPSQNIQKRKAYELPPIDVDDEEALFPTFMETGQSVIKPEMVPASAAEEKQINAKKARKEQLEPAEVVLTAAEDLVGPNASGLTHPVIAENHVHFESHSEEQDSQESEVSGEDEEEEEEQHEEEEEQHEEEERDQSDEIEVVEKPEDDVDVASFKIADHCSKLVQQLYRSRETMDIKFLTNQGFLRAHSAVVISSCPFFSTAFSQWAKRYAAPVPFSASQIHSSSSSSSIDMQESRSGSMDFRNVHYGQSVRRLLRAIYLGEVELCFDGDDMPYVGDFLTLAQKMGDPLTSTVIDACLPLMFDNAFADTVNNLVASIGDPNRYRSVAILWNYASKFSFDSLKEAFVFRVGLEFSELCKHQDAFNQLPEDLLLELIRSDDITGEEVNIFSACMKWLSHNFGHDEKLRTEKFTQIFELIRLSTISDSAKLESIIEGEARLTMEMKMKLYRDLALGRKTATPRRHILEYIPKTSAVSNYKSITAVLQKPVYSVEFNHSIELKGSAAKMEKLNRIWTLAAGMSSEETHRYLIMVIPIPSMMLRDDLTGQRPTIPVSGQLCICLRPVPSSSPHDRLFEGSMELNVAADPTRKHPAFSSRLSLDRLSFPTITGSSQAWTWTCATAEISFTLNRERADAFSICFSDTKLAAPLIRACLPSRDIKQLTLVMADAYMFIASCKL